LNLRAKVAVAACVVVLVPLAASQVMAADPPQHLGEGTLVAGRTVADVGMSGARVVVSDSQDVSDGRFGVVVGDHLPPIPAPEMPHVRLKQRR